MRRTITHDWPDGEFWQLLADFERSAWRWESRPVYAITDERSSLEAFQAGRPEDPMVSPYLAPWMHQVAALTAAGKTIGRVRVLEEPPTAYQQWELWLDRWNTESGEQIDYLNRSDLTPLGPAPFGRADWWLFDRSRIAVMHFDSVGYRFLVELVEADPLVGQAVSFAGRAVALARSVPQPLKRAA